MGNKLLDGSPISVKHFEKINVIGRGGYGRVWEVRHRVTKKPYAMKEMLKLRIVSKKSVVSVNNERLILAAIKHPFIVNMEHAFQDRESLYLVMDLMNGGDLRFHLSKQQSFSESESRFVIACIVTGLEFLHLNQIVHRDLKPENLVFDQKGYLRITDFGIARKTRSDLCRENSGTPGYMAPEVMMRKNHGIEVDYFSLGVLMYEFITGVRPYFGKTKKEIREHMMSRQVYLSRKDMPQNWSLEAADFTNKLLNRRPYERLGAHGPLEIKQHAWLRGFPWKKLFEKTLASPFANNCHIKHHVQTDDWDDYDTIMSTEGFQEYFADYFFSNDESSSMIMSN